MKFRIYEGIRYRGWIHSDLKISEWILDYPERLEEFESATPLLRCEGRDIFRLNLSVGGMPVSCFFYFYKNDSFSRSLRRNYAYRSLQYAQRLASQGIATLEILAAVKRRGEWLNRHSLIIAREILSVRELPSSGTHRYQIHPPAVLDSPLLEGFAEELARFHRQGFYHGDLKSRHVLVHTEQNPGFQFYFVDLEKCVHLPRFPAVVQDVLAARDLVQFIASLPSGAGGGDNDSLKERFLQSYLDRLGRPAHRRSRILRVLHLYGPSGRFRQGQTLLQGLLGSGRRDRR